MVRAPGWVLLGSWPLIQRTETKASQIIKRRVTALQRKVAEHLLERQQATCVRAIKSPVSLWVSFYGVQGKEVLVPRGVALDFD